MDKQRDLQQLKEYIVLLLSDIIKHKEAGGVQPFYAEMVDIQNILIVDAKVCLNELCKERMLTFHRTLNSVAFEFTPVKR